MFYPSNDDILKIEEFDFDFDFIIASLIFDVVAVNRKMFKDALENVIRYLKPGGHIVVQGSLGEHVYTVGSAAFPVMTADEDLILGIFQELKLQVVKWKLDVHLTTHYFCLLKKLSK